MPLTGRPQPRQRPRVHAGCRHASTLDAAERPRWMLPSVHAGCCRASTLDAAERPRWMPPSVSASSVRAGARPGSCHPVAPLLARRSPRRQAPCIRSLLTRRQDSNWNPGRGAWQQVVGRGTAAADSREHLVRRGGPTTGPLQLAHGGPCRWRREGPCSWRATARCQGRGRGPLGRSHRHLAKRFPKAAESMRDACADALAFTAFPAARWRATLVQQHPGTLAQGGDGAARTSWGSSPTPATPSARSAQCSSTSTTTGRSLGTTEGETWARHRHAVSMTTPISDRRRGVGGRRGAAGSPRARNGPGPPRHR